ncbi:DUF945 family protein [Halomonas garicola]|uniref:DUF945 family protein n=1 Tax=Halomonas garicola TaxID=1690008 RepID=UPI00289D0CA2|nr:DUF945 family protein [Halomonas garicola]
MDKKIIVAAGVAIVAGGFIAHAIAGNAAEKQIRESLAALEAEQAINVSQVETHKGLGKTSLTARLDAVDAPGLSGELAMDVGYLSRTAEGTMTFDGEALSGEVDFTTGLGSGKRDYRFDADELTAAGGAVTLAQVEGDGYVDAEREHFALDMLTRQLRLQSHVDHLEVNGLDAELEHNIDAEEGGGRSHARFAVDGVTVTADSRTADSRGTPTQVASLGDAEIRNTATLDGDTYSSRLYLAANDAVFMDSEPGRAELDLTAKGLDYAAFAALAEVLERHLKGADAGEDLSTAKQQALTRELRATLREQAHALLSRSPALELETLTLDAALPMLGRAEAKLSGRVAFDGDSLSPERARALLAGISAEAHEPPGDTLNQPAMSAQQTRAELASRLSARLAVDTLPDAIVIELPPALQALMINHDAPHVFAWEDGRALYNDEPLEQALSR